ncbi:hypothetical protein THAOC_18156 [Thalassiosira oceanica]|uniref:Uncharacterized protein n=1 Tax=Thalassiosira oceanica TaxID=159749 RepID=K0S5J4_THAOC|nr:hypothetical protein THAOC_18156 [Thalassiosira oceanica]|eukprot:EJK61378.1 hypothetical protein THAOC_18156 [Thalassiosira oceanica]
MDVRPSTFIYQVDGVQYRWFRARIGDNIRGRRGCPSVPEAVDGEVGKMDRSACRHGGCCVQARLGFDTG